MPKSRFRKRGMFIVDDELVDAALAEFMLQPTPYEKENPGIKGVYRVRLRRAIAKVFDLTAIKSKEA